MIPSHRVMREVLDRGLFQVVRGTEQATKKGFAQQLSALPSGKRDEHPLEQPRSRSCFPPSDLTSKMIQPPIKAKILKKRFRADLIFISHNTIAHINTT